MVPNNKKEGFFENYLVVFFTFSYLCCMKIRILLFLMLTTLPLTAANRILSPRFKTLTSIVNGDWMNRPVMQLNSNDVMTISFDELSHNFHRLCYRIEHCEYDWTTSESIFESDWLDGFNNNPIEDYQNSINTTLPYTHYEFSIPNDRCRLKMSGNYRMTIIDEDEGDEEVMLVEFYVVEQQMDLGLNVSSNTDIDHNVSHQQVDMKLRYNALRITNLEEELRTVVMQNWRDDTARRDLRPSSVSMQGLEWIHQRPLIFDAGNEYHKFEVLDVSHPTMGIDRIDWDGHQYEVYPFMATERRNYLTDVDADGAFCIRNSERSESAYTCEYVWVNFTLKAPYQGDLFIGGQWTTDKDRETYKMRYDGGKGIYYTRLLLKQGYYSYNYTTETGGIPPSEGSFYQTENRYQALVYYKSAMDRTWRLVGYRAVEFR